LSKIKIPKGSSLVRKNYTVPKPIPKRELKNLFRTALNRGLVSFDSQHLRERMFERNVDILDITHVLKKGRAKIESKWHDDIKKWRYTVTEKDLNNRKLSVPLEIVFGCSDELIQIFIITVF